MLARTANILNLLVSLSICGIATLRARMACTVPKMLFCTGTFLMIAMLAVSPEAGSAERVAQKLDGRLSITWHGQELGIVLERLSTTQGLTFWLDRRINPQQPVNVHHSNVTIREVLDRIAIDHSLGWSVLNDIIYIGPAESTNDLGTLAARMRQAAEKLPAEERNRWLSDIPTHWQRLSNPRAILETWFAEAGIKLSNYQELPHDLWDAMDLPPMNLADRVTLILIGFDKTCEITPNGRSCRIVPIKRPVLITKTHDAGNKARQVMAAFKEKKDVEIQRSGRQLTITGRWEDQQQAAEIIAGKTRTKLTENLPKRVSEQRFSLKLKNQPVGMVIDQLAGQLGLGVSWDQQLLAATPGVQETLISCEVSNGNLAELLESVLAPAGLGYRLNGNQLEIVPATP